jgi:vacuolar-type H+-ATPase subunit F/Vma7
MPKIVYVTEKSGDGVMASFGMEVHSHSLDMPIRDLIIGFKKDNVALVYVSEAIYKAFEREINALNHEFDITILVLANERYHEHLGEKRLKMLIEDAVGIKVD